MIAVVAGTLTAVAVVLATGSRPAPARIRTLVDPAVPGVRTIPTWWPWVGVGILGLLVPPLGVSAGGALLLGRWFRTRRDGSSRHRDDSVTRCLPEVVDLIALATTAGHPLVDAVAVTRPVLPAELLPGLDHTITRIGSGDLLDQAVGSLADSWGPNAAPLVHVLTDHLRYGTPLVPGLERLGTESRSQRRRAAEVRSRRLPVLLLFPLVVCVLPAFGLLTIAPLLAGTLGSLETSPVETSVSENTRPEGTTP